MRIVAAKAQTVRLGAAARSSSISFENMTATALAIHTDASRDGKALVGLAFDSIGRYDHSGLLNDRFIPRLLAADPKDYADEDGGIDPSRVWAVLMKNEKPGGHGERCGAVGLVDTAIWDLAAKRVELPLWRHLSKVEPLKATAAAWPMSTPAAATIARTTTSKAFATTSGAPWPTDTGGSRSRSAALRSVLTSNASRQCCKLSIRR